MLAEPVSNHTFSETEDATLSECFISALEKNIIVKELL
jgi:hypothetical protein